MREKRCPGRLRGGEWTRMGEERALYPTGRRKNGQRHSRGVDKAIRRRVHERTVVCLLRIATSLQVESSLGSRLLEWCVSRFSGGAGRSWERDDAGGRRQEAGWREVCVGKLAELSLQGRSDLL